VSAGTYTVKPLLRNDVKEASEKNMKLYAAETGHGARTSTAVERAPFREQVFKSLLLN
jgi:hypothetical protein